MEALYDHLKRAAARHAGDPLAAMQAICERFVAFGLDNPEYYEIMFQLRPEQMARYPAEKYRRARRNLDVIAATIAEGVDAGVFASRDPRVSASATWAALHGTVSLLLAQRIDIRIDRDAFIAQSLRRALRSVVAPAHLDAFDQRMTNDA
jgi:AcrR family transcriptional regulator